MSSSVSNTGTGASSAIAGGGGSGIATAANPLAAARYAPGREGSSNLGTFQVRSTPVYICWLGTNYPPAQVKSGLAQMLKVGG
jgi:hypothetical protein